LRTAAVLPVKRFALAKQRLGTTVESRLRQRLAAAMVADVLQALSAVDGLELTIVVTNEQSILPVARRHGALTIPDTHEDGQSAAAQLGVRRALAQGFGRVLLVPGDCPALDPAELDRLLARPALAPEVVILPDRAGSGTNGLLLTPPQAIAPGFGPGSCARHQRLASEAGVRWHVQALASVQLDIDTGEDLQALREPLRASSAGASRTRAVLGLAGPEAQPAGAGALLASS
jgi:2-phospho-L-lactate guanylyltransferase